MAPHALPGRRPPTRPGLSFWNTSAYTLEKALKDLVARINDLFGGELGPAEIEGFVKPIAAKAEETPGIADQIDNNAKDQFLGSRKLRESIIDAAFDVESVVGKLSRAAMSDDERAKRLIHHRRVHMGDKARTERMTCHADVIRSFGPVRPNDGRRIRQCCIRIEAEMVWARTSVHEQATSTARCRDFGPADCGGAARTSAHRHDRVFSR